MFKYIITAVLILIALVLLGALCTGVLGGSLGSESSAKESQLPSCEGYTFKGKSSTDLGEAGCVGAVEGTIDCGIDQSRPFTGPENGRIGTNCVDPIPKGP